MATDKQERTVVHLELNAEHYYFGSVKALCDNLYNAMETVTVKMHPVIDEIKASLIADGALGAIMSGSGPSVFGFFDDFKTAKKAASKFKDNCFIYTGWTY